MANEVQVAISATIRAGNVVRSYQESFQADMLGRKGPSPGAITVYTTGTDVDFSQLQQPGWVLLKNLDPTNTVEWGVKEPATGFFYPIGILRPGKSCFFEFSPQLLQEYTGTGTGTSAPTNKFHLKANTAACVVTIEAYEGAPA